jgi:hypothetical protein
MCLPPVREFAERTGRPLQPPRTWPEYVEIAKFLNSETLYGNILMGKEQTYTLWSGILYGLGGRPVDEHWRPQLHAASGVASLELFTEMFRYAPPRSEDRTLPDADLLFLQGRGAMYLAWPSLIWRQWATNGARSPVKSGGGHFRRATPTQRWSSHQSGLCRPRRRLSMAAVFSSTRPTQRLLLRYGKGSPRLSTYTIPSVTRSSTSPPSGGIGRASTAVPDSPRRNCPTIWTMSYQGDSRPKLAARRLNRTAARWREILVQSGSCANKRLTRIRHCVRALRG